MAASSWNATIAFILLHEGGFSDHKADPGGATYRGVTLAVFRAWRANYRLTATDLRNMEESETIALYESLYWNAVEGDLLPIGVDLMTADMAVNAGVRRSGMHLQECAGMTGRDIDGAVGPKTLEAVRAVHPSVLVSALNARHERHYKQLRTFNTFGRGWMNRLGKRTALANELLSEASA